MVERIVEAAHAWRDERFPKILGAEVDFVPLPGEPELALPRRSASGRLRLQSVLIRGGLPRTARARFRDLAVVVEEGDRVRPPPS
jgi:hypothetical protein